MSEAGLRATAWQVLLELAHLTLETCKMKQKTKFAIYNLIKPFFPAHSSRIRRAVLRWCGVELGQNVFISSSSQITSDGGRITIGDNVVIVDAHITSMGGHIIIGKNSEVHPHSILAANGNSVLHIGENVKIAHMVSLKTTSHRIDLNGECIGGDCEYRDITIGDGCWVCAGAIVIPGTNIGRKNVIAAGAVVIKNTPEGVLMAGNPARIKKFYPLGSNKEYCI